MFWRYRVTWTEDNATYTRYFFWEYRMWAHADRLRDEGRVFRIYARKWVLQDYE
jgi:hypothetical protein